MEVKFAVGPLFNSVRRRSVKIILKPAVSVEHGNHGNEVGHTHEDHVVPEIKIRDVKKNIFFPTWHEKCHFWNAFYLLINSKRKRMYIIKDGRTNQQIF